jgi:hypothetical protein
MHRRVRVTTGTSQRCNNLTVAPQNRSYERINPVKHHHNHSHLYLYHTVRYLRISFQRGSNFCRTHFLPFHSYPNPGGTTAPAPWRVQTKDRNPQKLLQVGCSPFWFHTYSAPINASVFGDYTAGKCRSNFPRVCQNRGQDSFCRYPNRQVCDGRYRRWFVHLELTRDQ